MFKKDYRGRNHDCGSFIYQFIGRDFRDFDAHSPPECRGGAAVPALSRLGGNVRLGKHALAFIYV